MIDETQAVVETRSGTGIHRQLAALGRGAGGPPAWARTSCTFPTAFDVATWIGALAPAGIGAERQQALHAAVTQSLAQPTVRQTLAQQGLEWVGSTPAEFETFMATEARRWNELVIQQRLSFG